MDYAKQLESGYLQVNDLNWMVRECRNMAILQGYNISWRIKKRTATVFLKMGENHIWKAEYTGDMPHLTICTMYCGLHAELVRKDKANKADIERMRLIHEEELRDRAAANLPDWRERRG